MKINQKLAALIIVAAGTLSTQVHAHESAVEQIVSNLVANAVDSVSIEIEQQVQKITLTASNAMAADGTLSPIGNTSITDLASKEVSDEGEDSAKDSEKDKQSENTDD